MNTLDGLTANEADEFDQQAQRVSLGDAALYFHFLTLSIGEHRIREKSQAHWGSYQRTKQLDQYQAVEQSVIAGWRKLIQKQTGIPPNKQSDIHAVNRAVALIALPWALNKGMLAEFFKRKSQTLHAAVDRADADFFRAMGRLLSEPRKDHRKYFRRFEFSYQMLARWLTDYYWLMPAKLVSQRLSLVLHVADDPKTLLAAKSRYGLTSHRPSLIAHFEQIRHNHGEPVERPTLTQLGRRLLE